MTKLEGGWGRVPARLRTGRVATNRKIAEVLAFGAESQVKFARMNLDRLVYDQQEPSDVTRSRRVYNSVKTKEGSGLERIAFVDPQDYDGFVYALTLEYGSDNWYWWGRAASRPFRARPFWRPSKAMARAEVIEAAQVMLALIRREMI